MAPLGFTFRLQHEDGTPADPATFTAAVPNWSPGDTIHMSRRTLRVIATRLDEGSDGEPVSVLVVAPVIRAESDAYASDDG